MYLTAFQQLDTALSHINGVREGIKVDNTIGALLFDDESISNPAPSDEESLAVSLANGIEAAASGSEFCPPPPHATSVTTKQLIKIIFKLFSFR